MVRVQQFVDAGGGGRLAQALHCCQKLQVLAHLEVFEQRKTLGHVADAALERFGLRSEEHTSELQSLMRISYAVFCLKKKNTKNQTANINVKSTKRPCRK